MSRTDQEPRPSHAQMHDLVGGSESMNDLSHLLARIAPSDVPVLVTGETGTGKELVSRAIHQLSPRRKKRFVAVNCGAIPESLIESELFGHEKGAFTGANERRRGVFETAHGGTLFLDEIGELPLSMQVKLLRVLDNQRFERVGGTEPVEVDVRLVFATNRDLQKEVEKGRFRSDLFYRIDVLRIEVPPLRQRKSDIQLLWEHFVKEAADREGRNYLETHPDVIRMLMRYDWPGNVRELRNLAHQALIRRSTGKITPRLVRDRLELESESVQTTPPLPQDFVPRTLEEIERDAIIRTFLAVDSVKDAAEILGISERKMYYRLKEYREAGFLEDEEGEKRAPEILLAHPEHRVVTLMAERLKDRFETVWVKDGLALLERVHRDPPAAIVTAVALPILDGINVLELSYEQGWDIPIVLIGRHDEEPARKYVDALGATAFLREPVDPGELSWVVQTALSTTVA